MSKTAKKLQKNIKKTKEKQRQEYPLKNQIMYLVKSIFAILMLSMFVYVLTAIVNKTYKLDNTSFYDKKQILAGQTFSRLEDEYYVAFYSFTGNKNLTTTIEGLSNQVIYRVDLDLANNKNIIASSSHINANNVQELKIADATIIKIINGQNVEYIEGANNVTQYLNSL